MLAEDWYLVKEGLCVLNEEGAGLGVVVTVIAHAELRAAQDMHTQREERLS